MPLSLSRTSSVLQVRMMHMTAVCRVDMEPELSPFRTEQRYNTADRLACSHSRDPHTALHHSTRL